MNSDDRLTRLEEQMIDIRLAVSALLETATQHQQNFETIQRNFQTLAVEMRDMRVDMLTMQSNIREMQSDIREIQSEVRGLQTENRRILDILQNRNEE